MDAADLEKFFPSLDTVLGYVGPFLRFLIMVGPLAMLGLGLYYFLAAPKEANYSAGYRFHYGMAKVCSWQFMQRLAGIVFSVMGLVLTIVMAIFVISLGKYEPLDMVMKAVWLLVWQIGLLVAAIVGIDVTVVVCFDSEGNRRKDFKGLIS